MKTVLAVLVGLLIVSSVNASPTDDLVVAAGKGDLDGIKKAVQQGANPNVLVCSADYILYPSSHERCADKELVFPLIWGVEKLFPILYKQEETPAIEKLLSSLGAKADVYSVNQKTGEIDKNGPDDFGVYLMNEKEHVDRPLNLLNAGFFPPERTIQNMQREQKRAADYGHLDTVKGIERVLVELRKLGPAIYCRRDFENSETIEAIQAFIGKYQATDPCGLVPQAKKRLAPLQKEKAKLAMELAREEAIQKAKEQKQFAAFRKSVKEGDETNCGAVIESKAKLVKIAFAVANYGNEHWIRREEIFPAGYGCQFINGQYQPPQ